MTKAQEIPIVSHGTSLLTRHLDALDHRYFGIDERSLADLMVFVQALARKIPFVNQDEEEEGNWAPFFENNLAFLLATISCINIHAIGEKFRDEVKSLSGDLDENEEKEKIEILLQYTFELFQMIDDWYKKSKHDLVHLEENKLAEHLKNAIQLKLNAQLKTLQYLVKSLSEIGFQSEQKHPPFNRFDPIWSEPSKSKLSDGQMVAIERLDQGLLEISKIHKVVFGVVTYLQNIAPTLLAQVLENYPYHAPHVSLLLSFLRSFQTIQKDTNQIVQRHLDYYYHEILRQSLRESSPDTAHVYFVPSEHIIKDWIPAGTLLSAGTDEEGLDYTYATDHGVELNQGIITDLKIIHVASNPLIGLGTPYKSVSNIYSQTVQMDEKGLALDQFGNPSSFHTFGQDQSEISFDHRKMEQAPVGFAIASSMFLLSEGKRQIDILYQFNLQSMSSLILFIEEMTKSGQTKEKKGRGKKQEGNNGATEEKLNLSPESAFHQILVDVFKLKITTATGWYETDKYEVLPPKTWTKGEFPISILLDISAPPITGYDEAVHGPGFSTQWPIISFELTSERTMYAYSYLKDLIIEKCTIDVKVEKVKNLQVFNDLGKIDINKPFTPFGNTQEVGSYFLVGNEEIFRKPLTNLSFDIQWHNLPRKKGGFESYYEHYGLGIKTSDFKVAIAGLSEFQFHPLDGDRAQQISIFSTDKKKDVLIENLKVAPIALDKLQIKPNYFEMDLTDYNSQTRAGFLKFEISGPPMGFGQSEYPRLFAEAMVENAKVSSGILKGGQKKKVEIPNEPYIPQIRTISMDYAASTTINMIENDLGENDKNADDRIFHIHPFGNLVVFEEGLPLEKYLLPQFDHEGYLIIGLENLQPPVELSIYFELEDNIKNGTLGAEIPGIEWRYLVHDTWVSFEEQEYISDSTNHFVTSGIVRLKIPSTINTKHQVLPEGKYWLSAAVPKNTAILSKTVLVHTNAVKAVWTAHKPGEQWKENIKENTIAGFTNTRTTVSDVIQPFPSFGGKAMENLKEFHIRVSESLRHKNRCVIPEDFEKVILQQFPYLFQAKCITHFSHPDSGIGIGNIKVVAVPRLESRRTFYEPKLDYNQLDEITRFLEQVISPFASVEVINPVYERVRVNSKVRLDDDLQSGEYVKQVENDLRRFICPWFGEEQQEVDFGGSIERDDIFSYLESLDYVRFVTKLSVVVIHNDQGKFSLSDSASDDGLANKLTSTAPWSVLTSDSSHDIELISKSINEMPEQTRIDTMKIGTDFVITDEEDKSVDIPAFKIADDTYYQIDIKL